MKRKLLLISYVFPPLPGIGGRRWAKFVKYLEKKNIELHVVFASNPYLEQSTYLSELPQNNLHLYPLNCNYPKFLQQNPNNLIQKIISKFQLFRVKTLTKGNYFDRSIKWNKYFLNQIPKIIINHNINKVVVSGPPFHYFLFALQLKKKFPIELIFDYRDPWSDFNVGFDNPDVSKGSRYEYELFNEKLVLQKADKVLCVSNFQKQLLKAKIFSKSFKPIIISNGFDKQDFDFDNSLENRDEILISHVGSLHNKKSHYYLPLLRAVKKLKETNIQYCKIKFDFIGNVPEDLIEFINKNELHDIVTLKGQLSHKDAIKNISISDIVLWFKFDESSGDYATKFYEYVYLKKFIWVFSVQGTVTNFIIKNRIGKVFLKNNSLNLEHQIYLELLNLLEKPPKFNGNFNTDKYDLEIISEKLINSIWEN